MSVHQLKELEAVILANIWAVFSEAETAESALPSMKASR